MDGSQTDVEEMESPVLGVQLHVDFLLQELSELSESVHF